MVKEKRVHDLFAGRDRLRRRAAARLLVLAAGLSLLGWGCLGHSGPRQFAMRLNGDEYPTKLKEPIGYLQEFEAGFSTENRCTVLFPLKGPFSMPKPGLEITFDPQKVAPNQEI